MRYIYQLHASGCKKTLAEGGCPDRRCDKEKNPSSKPCDDDTAFCTALGCKEHCLAGTDIDVPCTHYAFEKIDGETDADGAELGECYVFGSCKYEHDDSYIIYKMEDWCQKTLAEGCCPNERCDKTKNPSNKPCDDETAYCTVAGCKQHCVDGTGLTNACTHYSFEAVSEAGNDANAWLLI